MNARCSEKFGIFEAWRAIIVWKKTTNGLEVPCRYRFVAKRRLIKLNYNSSLLKLAFLKALTIAKKFTENTELINTALE